MRIVILTQDFQIYPGIIMKKLFEEKFNIVGIISSSSIMPKKSLFGSMLKISKDSGNLYLFFRLMEAMHQKFIQLAFPRKYSSVSRLAKKYDVPLYVIKDNQSIVKLIKKLNPELLISVFFNLIIKKEVYQIPKYGCINIHRAPLPEYRGPSSAFWQLSNNEKETAVTIHFVDSGVDSGAIISQKKFGIRPKDTMYSLCYRGAIIARNMLVRVIRDFERDNTNYIKQDETKATRFPFPTRDAMLNFLENSRRFF